MCDEADIARDKAVAARWRCSETLYDRIGAAAQEADSPEEMETLSDAFARVTWGSEGERVNVDLTADS